MARGQRTGRVWSVRAARELPVAPELAFGVLADTNRWNRLTRVSTSRHEFGLLDPDDPTSRTRIGTARYFGLRARFGEEGEYWAGRHMRGERRFVGGFVARLFGTGSFDVTVEPRPAGAEDQPRSHAELTVGVSIIGLLGYIVAPLILLQMWITMKLLLRNVARTLVQRAPSSLPRAAPPATIARRAHLAAGKSPRLSGDQIGKTARSALLARSAQLARTPVSERLQRKLLELITYQSDDELRQLRPFEVAAAWSADRREVLRAFLYGTRAGLFDLVWQVNCPTCQVASDVTPSLAALQRRIHCGECDVSFEVGFAENVEATFTVNAAVRRVEPEIYCASSPYYLPHLQGYVQLAPGARRVAGPLPPGDLLIRARGTPRQLVVTAGQRTAGAIAIRVTTETIALDPALAGEANDGDLLATNDSEQPVRLLVERAGWDAGIARGSLLMTMPEFHRMFATDAPATGTTLSVGTFAVAFTDVVGSTSLYQQIGDARAFALIQDHWRACAAIADRHAGAVVKTMGDGLMCCYASISQALAASFAMIEHSEVLSAREHLDFAIRVGVNEGPCFAVRADDRLDLFGNTVNLAARLMSAADGGEVALRADALAHPALRSQLMNEGIIQRTETTVLRGTRTPTEILFAARADAKIHTTGEHAPVADRV